ncbi:cytochrome P450 [Coprinopsis cinerea okayama7|uniref:Cytochrome P450 n=1 Tax=Coprinopsis cinerea (strain Okayama-7 / 130 / ATCC MYA-4618 / FGSC 9003) TaxID=240176 RepID=A8N271_COPC7|nr:cytochrome P450 [Coprinopsis cinerea okayama7\|eukprot:XP_001828944.1 cytochrome P450 [Coprinopsis cinerea okayama7\
MAVLSHSFLVLLRALGLAIGLVLLRGVVWLANMLLWAPLFDPLQKLPGPTGAFFESHLAQASNPQDSPDSYEEWRRAHGDTVRFHGFGKHDYRLLSFDFRAITHVLTSPVYEKPWQTRYYLSKLIGRGIFSTEGHEHKMQRKLISPAFSSQVVKNLSPIFLDKAEQLCDIWDGEISAQGVDSGKTVLNVAHWLSRTTFDIIGLGGFDYSFNSLEDESEPIHMAFRRMFRTTDNGIGLRDIVEMYFPIINSLWPDEAYKTVRESRQLIGEAGERIISQKRERILAEGKDFSSKDILSLLIKANMSTDPSSQLSDKDLLDQCTTFLLAGSDSSSVAMSWCLHLLATHPDVQNQLYDEVCTAAKASKVYDEYDSDHSDDSGFAEEPQLRSQAATSRARTAFLDAIESLPYLNGVVKETLRLYPPVHSTIRVATVDDEIPLSKPMTMPDGSKASSVKIAKGSYVHIPIEGVNNAEDIWGSDVNEFKPTRWIKLPAAVTSNFPGLGNLMTFGYGPSSCVGSKFTVSELKIIIATLVSRFEFTPAEGAKINKYNCIITRPYIEGRWAEGTQLPVQVQRRCP